jgi:3-oxoacyl-[acyl-carrier-protein] synthase-1
MNRVVVTGLGIVSSIGNGVEHVLQALRAGHSGMVYMPEMEELGYKCCIAAPVKGLDTTAVPRKAQRTMSAAATYAMLAAQEAIQDAGLPTDYLQTEKAGVIVGTALGGINEVPRAEEALAAGRKGSRLGAVGPARIMNATAAGHLAAHFGVRGRSCSISAACATGLYNIGHAYELIRWGLLDRCVCGSSEEDSWKHVGLSGDNGGGMPTDFNDRPARACRPFDRDRQGFVCSAGSGILILETLEGAERRGAKIYTEIIGYGAANDADDMYQPSGDGLRRSIAEAIRKAGVDQIDYINAHGTGTPIGDRVEAGVIRELFSDQPMVSSTKGINGHAQGGAGAQEAVYTILMLHHGFAAATANLENVAPECEGIRHVRVRYDGPLESAMTVNSGLGGTNACLILRNL